MFGRKNDKFEWQRMAEEAGKEVELMLVDQFEEILLLFRLDLSGLEFDLIC